MNVSIIGSGNVATVLGRVIKNAGHVINYILSRNHAQAELLARELNAKAVDDLNTVSSKSDLLIIAVPDAAISAISNELRSDKGIVVHTSGAVSKDVLKRTQHGVLYPLQSLRKELKQLPEIPFLVDGNFDEVTEKVKLFAGTLSKTVMIATDEERLKLHLAAVIVSNFTNHLYALTAEYCREEQIDFSFLFPLISEVANRLKLGEAKHLQTGPAVRGDEETIQKHLVLLEKQPALNKIYAALTESIRRFYKKGNPG